MGDLALFLVQVLDREPEQVACAREAETGAGRVVAENADAKSAVKDLRGNVMLAHSPQDIRHLEDRMDLVIRLVPGPKEILQIHVLGVQRLQVAEHLSDSALFFHNTILPSEETDALIVA